MVCVICGSDFAPKSPSRPARTCSRSCTNKMVWREKPTRRKGGPTPRPRVIKLCEFCGRRIPKRERPGEEATARFCSRVCTGRAKGRSAIYVGPDGRARVNLRDGSKQWYARCLMEGHLKRHLGSDDVVHHVNGDCWDDRIENLQLVTRGEHIEIHRAEIVARRRDTAPLTRDQVAYIKASAEATGALARRFGVTGAAIVYHRGPVLKAQSRGL